MKPTDTNIAKFYGITRMTLHNYKNGDAFKQRLYEAMKNHFIYSSNKADSKLKLKITNLKNGLTKMIDADDYTMEDLQKSFLVYEASENFMVQIVRV